MPIQIVMANTYSQIYIHVVFVVKYRRGLISEKWKDELCKYITGIVKGRNQKLIIVNGVSDHIHILLAIKPDCKLSDLVRDIKSDSALWINTRFYKPGYFRWQNGFGAFSVGHSRLNNVIQYIENQEAHHAVKLFRKEYEELLLDNEIDFKSEYVFQELT